MSDFEGEEWLVQSRTFSREDDPSSYFSREDEPASDYDYDDDLPGSPLATAQEENRGDLKVKKSALDKELEKLASLKIHLPPCAVSEEEFETRYGLPNKGKNPHKLRPPADIQDKDVTDVFRPPKGRKGRAGYHYGDSKDDNVLNRIAEIFPLVYLRDLPKSKVIAKQFARGIVMEVLKQKPVSWAEFAAVSNRNQRSKWLKKVKFSLRTIGQLTANTEEHLYVVEGIDDLYHDPTTRFRAHTKDTQVVKEKDKVLALHCGADKEINLQQLQDLIKLVGLQLHVVTGEFVTIKKTKAELTDSVSQEEGVLRRTQEKIARMQKLHVVQDVQHVQNVHVSVLDVPNGVQGVPVGVELDNHNISKKEEAYLEMLKDARLDYEAAVMDLDKCNVRYEELLTRQTCLRRQSDALLFQLSHMKRGEVGIAMRPTPHCFMFDSGTKSDGNAITLQPCALCGNHFPFMDIVVSSCGHLYHPWCAAAWFRVASTCVHGHCGITVHPSWFRSFGFGQLHEPLDELEQTLELEKEERSLVATLISTLLESCPEVGKA